MNLLLLLLFSILPAWVWLWIFRRQDRAEPEPVRFLLLAFFAGMAAVIPVGLFEASFRQWLIGPTGLGIQLAAAIFLVSLPEEAFKLLVTWGVAFRSDEFDEVMDGVMYGVAVGLGFAAAENLLYTAAFGWQVAPVRAVIASLAHSIFSGLVGFSLGLAKQEPQRGVRVVGTSLLAVVLLHGLYDFALLLGPGGLLVAFALLGAGGAWLFARIRRAGRLSPFR